MNSRIFCAIDSPDLTAAERLADALRGQVAGLKLGLEFFCALGAAGYKLIAGKGLPIFLDLKLHDIPNTVAKALEALLPLHPAFVTLHASGGAAMLQEAAKAAAKAGSGRPKLLAVTVLTSLAQEELKAIGQQGSPLEQVERLARLAKENGMDGVVCSPQEVAHLRKILGSDFILMVPGIRPAGADIGDQKRAMTPGEAVAAGATYLVIGRPITQAADPAKAAAAIHAEYA